MEIYDLVIQVSAIPCIPHTAEALLPVFAHILLFDSHGNLLIPSFDFCNSAMTCTQAEAPLSVFVPILRRVTD